MDAKREPVSSQLVVRYKVLCFGRGWCGTNRVLRGLGILCPEILHRPLMSTWKDELSNRVKRWCITAFGSNALNQSQMTMDGWVGRSYQMASDRRIGVTKTPKRNDRRMTKQWKWEHERQQNYKSHRLTFDYSSVRLLFMQISYNMRLIETRPTMWVSYAETIVYLSNLVIPYHFSVGHCCRVDQWSLLS